jgi:Tfp pilus assembly protein PilX
MAAMMRPPLQLRLQPPLQPPLQQRGLALPVMLIMLVVMMISSIYLLRSTNSTALTTSNLAYDDQLSKAADLGIHTAYNWLQSLPDKAVLQNDVSAAGYVATINMGAGQGVTSAAFWQGSTTVMDANNVDRVEYVIHRLCQFAGPYNATAPKNNCTLTAPRKNVQARTRVGQSVVADAPDYLGSPQLHYVITARISGPRGGNVTNQAVVMMGP